MAGDLARRTVPGTSAHTARVHTFPGQGSYNLASVPTVAQIVVALLDDPRLEQKVKSVVESSIFDSLIKLQIEGAEVIDDPFDSIYISELKPDQLNARDLNRLGRTGAIKDLSDNLHLADPWEE